MNKKLVLVLLTGVAMIYLLWPVTSLNCPRWELQVVDQEGTPLEGMTVRVVYQNYSAESRSHEGDRLTDKAGHAVFPARTLTMTRARRILATLASATGGVHASFGPHAHVLVFGKGLEGDVVENGVIFDWTGSPNEIKSRIVAKPAA